LPAKVSRHVKRTRTSPEKKVVFQRRERVLTPTEVEEEPTERTRGDRAPVEPVKEEPVEHAKEDEE